MTVDGNPDLEPETADTVTAGIIVRPEFESSWARDLQFTIDWYRIEIDDVVTDVDAATAVLELLRPGLQSGLRGRQLLVHACSVAIRAPAKLSTPSTSFYNLAASMTSGVDIPARLEPARRTRGAGRRLVCRLAGRVRTPDDERRTCGPVCRNDRRLCRLLSGVEVANQSSLRVARLRRRSDLAIRRLDGRHFPVRIQDDRLCDAAQELFRHRRRLPLRGRLARRRHDSRRGREPDRRAAPDISGVRRWRTPTRRSSTCWVDATT